MTRLRMSAPCAISLAAVTAARAAAGVGTVPVRVAAYNIDADTGSTTVNDAAITTVLGGIGNANPDGVVHPLDILGLEETTSNAVTVAPIVADLNKLYPTASYAVPALQPGEVDNDPGTGNGPNSIVYNTATLQLVGSTVVGTAGGSGNGVYRQIARYEFEPATALGGTAAGAFYVYVDHYKSGSTTADLTARGQEGAIVRADVAALPANSRAVEMGDLNIGASTEASIVNLTAAGPGQMFDPIDTPGNYATNPAFAGILTESSTDLRYRDDLQLITGNVRSDPTGLQYTPGSYTAFGNNGTTAVYGTVAASTNTALPGLSNRTAVLTALTQVTDHLPVVADYADVVGPTVANWALATGGTWGTVPDWTTTVVPTGAGTAVTFGPTLTAAGTVTLDGGRTVGRVTFASAAAYTLAAGTGGTLTVDDTSDLAGVAPAITVAAGSHTITAPVSLAAGVTITTAAGTGLTIGGAVTGSGTVTAAGAGTLTFAADGSSTPLVRTLPGLNVSAGATVVVAAGAGRTLLAPASLSVAGRLDLTTNDLDVPGGSLAAVTALAATAYAGGAWTGAGLTSSAAAADPAHLTAVGVIANGAADGSALYASFDGQPVAATDVLARVTTYGDANLDGRVDAADYLRVDAGYVNHLTGWANGDFNYDGVVDGSDYTLIDNAFDTATPTAFVAAAFVATTSAELAAVPEPGAGMLVIGVAAVSVGVRRRRAGGRTGA